MTLYADTLREKLLAQFHDSADLVVRSVTLGIAVCYFAELIDNAELSKSVFPLDHKRCAFERNGSIHPKATAFQLRCRWIRRSVPQFRKTFQSEPGKMACPVSRGKD